MISDEGAGQLPTDEQVAQMTPGQRIRHYRLLRGLSQASVASLMRLAARRRKKVATDGRQVGRWEAGTHAPCRYTRHLLAEVLGVTVVDLGLRPDPYFR